MDTEKIYVKKKNLDSNKLQSITDKYRIVEDANDYLIVEVSSDEAIAISQLLNGLLEMNE